MKVCVSLRVPSWFVAFVCLFVCLLVHGDNAGILHFDFALTLRLYTRTLLFLEVCFKCNNLYLNYTTSIRICTAHLVANKVSGFNCLNRKISTPNKIYLWTKRFIPFCCVMRS